VRSLNVCRRHLSTHAQRRVIADFLRREPAAKDRQIAGRVGCDNHTVARVRRRLEDAGEIPTRNGHAPRAPDRRADQVPVELPTKDFAGRPIPAELQKRFACAPLAALARTYRQQVRGLAADYNLVVNERAGNPYLKADPLLAAIQKMRCAAAEAAAVIEQSLPFAVCPRCSGATCKACEFRGVVPRGVYRELTAGAGVAAGP
jgi:hypothetical protein